MHSCGGVWGGWGGCFLPFCDDTVEPAGWRQTDALANRILSVGSAPTGAPPERGSPVHVSRIEEGGGKEGRGEGGGGAS